MKRWVGLYWRCFALFEACVPISRDHSRVCVGGKPADMAAIEGSGVYNGTCHILRGLLSPMDDIGLDELRIAFGMVMGGDIKYVDQVTL